MLYQHPINSSPSKFAPSRVFLRGLILMLLSSLFSIACSSVQAQAARSEYELKAAFLYNFVKYIEWPAHAIAENDPITIGFLGQDLFTTNAVKLGGQSVNGHAIKIVRFASIDDDFSKCNMLFVSASEKEHLKPIFSAVSGKYIVTVGETEEFTNLGGMINLIRDQQKIHFEINVDAAKRAELNIKPALLNLAKIKHDTKR